MRDNARRKMETELVAMGLNGISEGAMIEQLANLVSAWPGDKHEYLRDLINECEPEKRYEMYHAIAPKLKFKALTLEQYEARIALKAGEMVSQGRMLVEGTKRTAIEIGGHKVVVVDQCDATQAVATVRCYLCNKKEQFLGDTPTGAMIEARRKGWVRDPAVNKETCAECAADVVGEEIVVLSRAESLSVKDRRRRVN